MIKEAIDKAVNKIDLQEAEMMAAMEEIMDGAATQAQIAAFITALRMKAKRWKKSPARRESCAGKRLG
jgi:anthranilate phosphoribosyltransferase